MKNIKDLTIKVTYRVGLGNVEVPDEVYNELAKAYDEGGDVPEWDDELENAKEWLSDNIRETGSECRRLDEQLSPQSPWLSDCRNGVPSVRCRPLKKINYETRIKCNQSV